jgi:ubiquinone/menaquinone biosynthesis C-methylase UbiE
LTSKVFGALPVVFRGREFPSSYDVLSAAVPKSEAPIQVLDLACGDGFLLSMLAARSQPGLAVCGVDMNLSELELARARLPSAVVLRQSRAQALPFASESFDYVLSHLALMLMDDVEQVLREIRRVMKPRAVFAAIIGESPPPSAAFDAYVEVLTRHPPSGEYSGMRFGDRRLRHPEGIQEILSLALQSVLLEEIRTSRRLTPHELWSWFLNMYDLHLRSEIDRQNIEREYLALVAPHCGPDGKMEYFETMRYVSALA